MTGLNTDEPDKGAKMSYVQIFETNYLSLQRRTKK